MTNDTIFIKAQERLNKLASYDMDNLEAWQVVEAFNKAQLEFAAKWIEYAEKDKQRIEWLQLLLKQEVISGSNNELYYETIKIPSDFLAFKRVDILASNPNCSNSRSIVAYLTEEANIGVKLKNPLENPSWEWGETLTTLIGNRIRVYTDSKFKVDKLTFTYYRNPTPIAKSGAADLSKAGLITYKEQECEFQDSIVEKIIDRACAILSGDMEDFNQTQRFMSQN